MLKKVGPIRMEKVEKRGSEAVSLAGVNKQIFQGTTNITNRKDHMLVLLNFEVFYVLQFLSQEEKQTNEPCLLLLIIFDLITTPLF